MFKLAFHAAMPRHAPSIKSFTVLQSLPAWISAFLAARSLARPEPEDEAITYTRWRGM